MKSLVNYPKRGPWGDSKYIGNCSGHLIKELIEFYQPHFVVDPAEGSGTTGDVCNALNISYLGLDLHSGFNLLKDDLRKAILKAFSKSRSPDFIFFHPPYHDIVPYSGNVWGEKPHSDDLSRCLSYKEFLIKLRKVIQNVYKALAEGGHLAILIGDVRKNGHYFMPHANILNFRLGKIESVIIKAQHNMRSSQISYSGKPFIHIVHEYCLIFQKPAE